MIEKILDPIYGDILIDEDEKWVLDILETDAFLRLKDIKQLGLCYLKFPSAVQTRYAHSLGTFYLTKILLSRVDIKKKLTLDQIKTLKAAALLHDIGHGPHSHGFEWYLKELGNLSFRHEDYSCLIIKEKKFNISHILELNNINPDDVINIINSKYPSNFPKWTSQIISSEIDMDRLDYLLRDQYFIYGWNSNARSLMQIIYTINIDEEKQVLYFNEEDIIKIDDFLYTRYKMYKNIYLSSDVERWYLLLIEILLKVKKYYDKNISFKDKYNLFNVYKFMFNDKKITMKNYIETSDKTFDLYIDSLKYENGILKELVNNFQKGNFSNLKINTKSKEVYFYLNDKPIYIKLKSSGEIVTYESISDFYKLFNK